MSEEWPGEEWPGTEQQAQPSASGADAWPGQEWPGKEVTDGDTPATARSGPAAETPLASGVREGAHAVVPGLGSLAGVGYGMSVGAIGGPVGSFIGGVVGGVAAGIGTSYVQEKALEAAGFDDAEQRAANEAENPNAALAGGIAGSMVGLSPSAAASKLAPAANQLIQRGAGAAFGGAMEAGHEAYEGDGFSAKKILANAGAGAVMPGVNRLGNKFVAAGERIPGRPGASRNPAADPAHEAVGDTTAEIEVGDSSLAQSPPTVGEAQVATTGNPQSAPVRSSRIYKKGSDPAEQSRYGEALSDPEAMRQFAHEEGLTEAEAREIAQANYQPEGNILTQGDVAPDVAAALKSVEPAQAEQPAPVFHELPAGDTRADTPQPEGPAFSGGTAEEMQNMGAPALTGTARQNHDGSISSGDGASGVVFPKAAKAIARSKRTQPEQPVDTAFPQAGDPVAVGANEATPVPERAMPRNETAVNASVTDAQLKAGNYPKERTHDFGKPQRIETYAGDTRRNSNPEGPRWENKADYDYGYFNKTIGKDKDHVDFARPPQGHPDRGDKHFVIDQKNAETGKFDEHKVFTDYKDEATARRAYESGFSDGKGGERLGAIKEISRPELVKVLARHTSKPWNKPYSMVEEKAVAAKPAKERAVIKDLITKAEAAGDTAKAEAIRNAPEENLLAAAEGKRLRKYGTSTGNSAGYAVEGVTTADGKPVTANTKAKAQARGDRHAAVKEWFDTSTKKSHDYETETDGAILDRLRKGQETINSYDAMKSDPVFGKGSWVPSHKPREWMWAREANNLLKKPTPGAIKKFRDAERLLKGSDADVENYRSGNRVEADIARSKRGGDEAVANAEAKNVDLGVNSAEDEMVARIDAKRGGKFDVPHEEAETMVKPKPVKTAADIRKPNDRVVDVSESSLARRAGLEKLTAEAKAKGAADKAKAEAALQARGVADLAGKKPVEANVASEDRKGGEVKTKTKAEIKTLDPAEKARIMENLNRATGKDKKLDALPPERDPDVVPKKFIDLFEKFVNDEHGGVNPGAVAADMKRLMDTLTTRAADYMNARPALKRALDLKKTDRDSFFAAASRGAEDDYARSLGLQFRMNQGEHQNHQLRLQREGNKLPEGLNAKTMEEIYHAREADSAGIKPANGAASHIDNLDPALKSLYERHLKGLLDENDAIAKIIRTEYPKEIGAHVENHMQRIRAGDQERFNLLLPKTDDPTQPGFTNLMVNANAAKDRKFYALERTADGRRTIISPTDTGFQTHIKGAIQRIKDPNFEFEDGGAFKAGPVDYTMRQATTKEIEKHVLDDKKKPMKYYKNAGFSAALTNLQLGSMLRNLELVKSITNSPEFKKLSVNEQSKRGEEMRREGWAEPNMENFKGKLVHPAVKAALDDAAGTPLTWLQRVSGAVTKTMFWIPVAHIDNEGTHWFTGRGVDWMNPAAYVRMAKTLPEAFMSVVNQDHYQQQMRDRGAGMILASVLTKEPTQKLAKAFQVEMMRPERAKQWQRIADKLGVPFKALHDAIYDNSQKVLWASHDILLTQRVKELELAGSTMGKAIIEAQRDIPAYILPIKIMGSRTLQQQLANNKFFVFTRYHYGMWNSFANQFKDLLGKNSTLGDRIDGAGKLMATAMLVSVIYPYLWDKGAKLLTGNEDATAQRRGPTSIPSKLIDAAHGKGDVSDALRSSLTISPLATTALEEYNNKDFRGKPIRQPGDVAGTATQKGRALVSTASHVAKGVISPLSTFSTGASKDESVAGTLRDQAADIKNPSKASVKYDHLKGMHNQRDTIQNFRKNKDPIVQGYNKLFGYK